MTQRFPLVMALPLLQLVQVALEVGSCPAELLVEVPWKVPATFRVSRQF